ncbi:MAG: hypothetical protein OCD02_11355 [Spirochaetaceae bacterium]
MNDDDLFDFQDISYLCLSNKNVSQILGVSETTFSRWKRGKSRIEDPKYIFGLKMISQISSKLNIVGSKNDKFYEYYFANILRYRFNMDHLFKHPVFPPVSSVFFALEFLQILDRYNIKLGNLSFGKNTDYISYLTNKEGNQYVRNNKIYYFENSISYSERKEIVSGLESNTESIIYHINKNNEVIYSCPSETFVKNVDQSHIINDIIFAHIANFLINMEDSEFILELLNSITEIDNFGLLYLYNHYASLEKYWNSKEDKEN